MERTVTHSNRPASSHARFVWAYARTPNGGYAFFRRLDPSGDAIARRTRKVVTEMLEAARARR